MNDLKKIFSELIQREYQKKAITRIEGKLINEYSEKPPSFEQLIESGYTVHLDLQQLEPETRLQVWNKLINSQTLTKRTYNPFEYRKNTDQFGILHEEYNISWLDLSGILWSYMSHHWHKQAFHHPENYDIFRSTKEPELIMLRKQNVKPETQTFKATKDKNVISIQLLPNEIQSLNNKLFANTPDEYHKEAHQKLTRLKAMNCSFATLSALVIWFLFQYPPSTAFFLGVLATIGIPFFTFDLALLAIISLASILISIGINYIYSVLTPETDINFWQTLNKICYNIAFFVIPLTILICIPAAALNVNLLIIAGIAALFAIYHYICLNEWHNQESSSIVSRMASMFTTTSNDHEKSIRDNTQSPESQPK
ncbi:MAG: hypothetical protein P8L77_05675 [Gammaproteobacteria bacterium]|nr:hypothetical protein [Gammaproteobacteria bacterium]